MMSNDKKKYLLDTNFLLNVFEKENFALKRLREILDDSVICITPLIFHEFLRGTKWDNKEEEQAKKEMIEKLIKLPNFVMIEITQEIADKATDMYRVRIHQQSGDSNLKPNKHNFDMMYYATKEIYDLNFISCDNDMNYMKKLSKDSKNANG